MACPSDIEQLDMGFLYFLTRWAQISPMNANTASMLFQLISLRTIDEQKLIDNDPREFLNAVLDHLKLIVQQRPRGRKRKLSNSQDEPLY